MTRAIRRGRQLCLGVSASVAVSTAATIVLASSQPLRFFRTGDGTLALSNAHTDERLRIRYRDASGEYDPAALKQIRHVLRSRDGREGEVSLRLIELLAYVQREAKPSAILVISGYRSPDYNAGLRGAAESSLHTQGLAADVMLPGVDLVALWKRLRDQRSGGVGLYRDDGYLHIDTGPARFWEKQTSRVGEHLSAENARLFARTEFDVYQSLEDAWVELHSITLFPVHVSSRARLAGYPDALIRLKGGDGVCVAISEPAERQRIYIESIRNMPRTQGRRTRVLLSTCEPRLGHTPATIESNEIEIVG